MSNSLVSRWLVVGGLLGVAALFGACGGGGNTDAAVAPDAVIVDCASGDAAAGRVAVGMRACASCHAADLGGATTGTPGGNLTPHGLSSWSDREIAEAILHGTGQSGMLCTSMTRFGPAGMTATEACNIVAHLRSLDPITRDIPDTCM